MLLFPWCEVNINQTRAGALALLSACHVQTSLISVRNSHAMGITLFAILDNKCNDALDNFSTHHYGHLQQIPPQEEHQLLLQSQIFYFAIYEHKQIKH
ncbi:unnamed protein product [Prunus armeniaca]|uniref:Uncharacterized protein n=1 Tax=Prunus armeniaca TaxID=36596 RepID=A0A6J5YEL1_PRUAR|nr:unnamed protein product [Prunus armeniaca]